MNKYKNIISLIIFCIYANNIVWSQSINEPINKVVNNFQKFSTFSIERNEYDSISHYANSFYNSLLIALRNDFESTFKQLPQLLKDGIHITYMSSADNKLHFISWDDQSGGTMRNASCIVAYASNGKYVVENFYQEQENEEGGFNPFVRELHQVDTKTGPIYLIFDLFIGSSALYYPSCKTLIIENDTLIKDAKYIKTQSGLNNSISYEVDFTRKFYRENNNRSDINFYFQYDTENSSFNFPIILPSGEIKSKRIHYQFDGQYFIKKIIK